MIDNESKYNIKTKEINDKELNEIIKTNKTIYSFKAATDKKVDLGKNYKSKKIGNIKGFIIIYKYIPIIR